MNMNIFANDHNVLGITDNCLGVADIGFGIGDDWSEGSSGSYYGDGWGDGIGNSIGDGRGNGFFCRDRDPNQIDEVLMKKRKYRWNPSAYLLDGYKLLTKFMSDKIMLVRD